MPIINLDPAKRAAEQIARRNVGKDIDTMTIIIHNAYVQRIEEIKRDIEKHCREVFDKAWENEQAMHKEMRSK